MPANSLGIGQVVYLYGRDNIGLGTDTTASRAQAVLTDLINFEVAGQSGAVLVDAMAMMPNTGPLAAAFCTAALSSAAGTVGVIINGVSLTVTTGASDQATMDLLVAAVNASTNALIKGIAKAGYDGFVQITAASVAAGDSVVLSGIELDAVAGTRNFRQFSKDTSDTATATDLAVAINQDPVLGHYWAAISSAGVVKAYPRFPTASAPVGLGGVIVSSSNGTRLAVVQLAQDPSCAICAVLPGVQGNAISIIATGTGASIANTVSPTAAYASGNKLLGKGTGADDDATTRYYGRLP